MPEDTPVLDTLAAMTAISVAECELTPDALLLVRLADHGTGQVQELAVDGLEECEKGSRVGEFILDTFSNQLVRHLSSSEIHQ